MVNVLKELALALQFSRTAIRKILARQKQDLDR